MDSYGKNVCQEEKCAGKGEEKVCAEEKKHEVTFIGSLRTKAEMDAEVDAELSYQFDPAFDEWMYENASGDELDMDDQLLDGVPEYNPSYSDEVQQDQINDHALNIANWESKTERPVLTRQIAHSEQESRFNYMIHRLAYHYNCPEDEFRSMSYAELIDDLEPGSAIDA